MKVIGISVKKLPYEVTTYVGNLLHGEFTPKICYSLKRCVSICGYLHAMYAKVRSVKPTIIH